MLAPPARSPRTAPPPARSRNGACARSPWPSRAKTARTTEWLGDKPFATPVLASGSPRADLACSARFRLGELNRMKLPRPRLRSATSCDTSYNAAVGYQYCPVEQVSWEDVMPLFRARPLLALCALMAVLAFAVTDADARAGRGGSFGSRGSQTFSAPPSTTTSPSARPIERSMTQPSQPGGTFAQRPPVSSPVGGFLNRPGFLGGLFAGFLGAGLLGMLFGHGFLGGLGGVASMLGLMLQIGIIVIVGYLLWTWWQRRSQPALASGPVLRDYASGTSRSALGFGLGGGAPRSSARASGTDEVGLTPDDFNAFEKTL